MFILTWTEIFRGRDRVWYVLEWRSDERIWGVWELGKPVVQARTGFLVDTKESE